MNLEVSRDAYEMCMHAKAMSRRGDTEQVLKENNISPNMIFYTIEKTKHNGMVFPMYDMKDFSDVALSFLEKNKREILTSELMSDILKLPKNYINYCYFDVNGTLNIFQIPLVGQSRIYIVVCQIELGKWGIKTYNVSYSSVEQKHKYYTTSTSEMGELTNAYRCPKTGYLYPPCSFCGNMKIKTHRCGGCAIIHYCNVTCQRKDWNTHKIKCKEITKRHERN